MPMRRTWIICSVLAAITFAVFWPVFHNEFIITTTQPTSQPMCTYRAGLRRESGLVRSAAVHSGNWHPLTWLSHMLDVRVLRASIRAGTI